MFGSDTDLNGWNVRNTLRLFWKSNPALVEWIQSPITYLDRSTFRARALASLLLICAVHKGVYHYRSMARTNYRGHLREPMVKLKKYFYVLRPLLAARWVPQTRRAAPIELQTLLRLIEGNPPLLKAVHALRELKPTTLELNAYIEAELEAAPIDVPKKSHSSEVVFLLNSIFRAVLDGDGLHSEQPAATLETTLAPPAAPPRS